MAPAILNTFGARFLENGYQLPGTEDGGITDKKNFNPSFEDGKRELLVFGF